MSKIKILLFSDFIDNSLLYTRNQSGKMIKSGIDTNQWKNREEWKPEG
jgi:hypothetical protein